MEIITLINQLMAANGLTVGRFAARIGAPKVTVESVMYGKRQAGVEFLRRLATAYPKSAEVRRAIVKYIYNPAPTNTDLPVPISYRQDEDKPLS
ncbi:regulatory protein [Caudoviricetes sp.]|nr:regulatory protein [Caudoviricetes sp.]UOF81118.1 regulatory protein [Caudoviricetes sp.]UOF82246.1 regulatory protein [Caudoviricetes sp.]UOF82463.1 regulatory protein [Caudoviricetes sp.]UOF82617.1 regulatory protein [Caudoviricetes sp.]